jgi:phosphoribosylanthranilate isomerase
MKFKICGMKYYENIKAVAELQPDYLGFIFYDKSKRNFDGEMPDLHKDIKKTGVFVNATFEDVFEIIIKYQLNAVQLHGEESVEFCEKLKKEFITIKELEIIKVFSVGDDFNFNLLDDYKDVCDYFLFDTKGKERGGNGIAFNWEILKDYPIEKPYFLSGGIGSDEFERLKIFLQSDASKHCYAIDVNSKFETDPGMKDIDRLKIFYNKFKI